MHKRILFIAPFLLLLLAGCNKSSVETSTPQPTFSTALWQKKAGHDYPHRKDLYHNLLYSDSLRTLSKTVILEMLGPPDRATEGYLYYMIEQERIGLWPLHSRFLVFKFKPNNNVEWIKLHG